jgi:hypothetical protein
VFDEFEFLLAATFRVLRGTFIFESLNKLNKLSSSDGCESSEVFTEEISDFSHPTLLCGFSQVKSYNLAIKDVSSV